jgi:hypothetical protein
MARYMLIKGRVVNVEPVKRHGQNTRKYIKYRGKNRKT